MTLPNAAAIQAAINAANQNLNASMASYSLQRHILQPWDDEGAWQLTDAEHVGDDVE